MDATRERRVEVRVTSGEALARRAIPSRMGGRRGTPPCVRIAVQQYLLLNTTIRREGPCLLEFWRWRYPAAMDYGALPGLSAEEREILGRVRPATLHAAARTPGVRPSTLLSLFQIARK